jgi:DNA polymerase III gamma/tau subunit
MLSQTAGAELIEASQEDRALYQAQAGQIARSVLLRAVRLFNEAVNNYRGGWQPQLTLELALIESTRGADEEMAESQSASRPASTAKPPAAPPEPEAPPQATAPGTAPVVPLTAVREQWDDILKALYRYSKTGPDVLSQFFHPQKVDGNTIFLATANHMQFKKLQEPDRISAVQKAFGDVFKTRLVVKTVLVSDADQDAAGDAPPPENPDVDPDDPLLSTGRELGAKIRRRKEAK